MKSIALVVIAYNRKDSLHRLLQSLDNAIYDEVSIPLYISIDKSNTDEVERFADEHSWRHGKKTVVKHERNLGLRAHVLEQGRLLDKYDAIVILEDDLVVTAARAGAEPTDIVSDVGHRGGDGFEERVAGDETVALSVRFEVVLRFDEGDSRLFGEEFGDRFAVLGIAVNTGTDGGAPCGQFADFFDSVVSAFNGQLELTSESAEFLTEGHRGRVGEVGASDFDDVFPLFSLSLEDIAALFESGNEAIFDLDGDGDVNRGREGVVRRLTAVDVIVRVNLLVHVETIVTGEFESAVRNDFVRVHVRRGARTGLIDVNREFLVKLTVSDFLARGEEGVELFLIKRGATLGKTTELIVSFRSAKLDEAKRVDELRSDQTIGNREILNRALGLGAVISVFRERDFSHGVAFDTNFSHLIFFSKHIELVVNVATTTTSQTA